MTRNCGLNKQQVSVLELSLFSHFATITVNEQIFNIRSDNEKMKLVRLGIEILLYHDVIETYYFNISEVL